MRCNMVNMNSVRLESALIFLVLFGPLIALLLMRTSRIQKSLGSKARPAIKSYRQPYSFSLQALLLVTTLIAIVLGLMGYLARK
jgi:hypothetical protein